MIKKKDISKEQVCSTIFLKTSPEQHLKSYDILKSLPKKGIIFTTTRPADSLEHILATKIKNKNIFFIDCISESVGYKKKCANAVYLDSPESLTAISIAIRKLLKKLETEDSFLIFDSLSKLTFYHKINILFKFFNSLVNMCRTTNTHLVILGIEEDIPKTLRDNIEEMCDKVLKVK